MTMGLLRPDELDTRALGPCTDDFTELAWDVDDTWEDYTGTVVPREER